MYVFLNRNLVKMGQLLIDPRNNHSIGINRLREPNFGKITVFLSHRCLYKKGW